MAVNILKGNGQGNVPSWKAAVYFGGFLPVGAYVNLFIWHCWLTKGEQCDGVLLALHTQLMVVCTGYAVITFKRPGFFQRFRDELLLLYLIIQQDPWFLYIFWYPLTRGARNYYVECAFNTLCAVWLDLPLRYTLVHCAFNVPLFTYVITADLHQGSTAWTMPSVVHTSLLVCLAALPAVLIQVALYKNSLDLYRFDRQRLATSLKCQDSTVDSTVFCQYWRRLRSLLFLLEDTLLDSFQSFNSQTLIAAVCYPPLALTFFRQMSMTIDYDYQCCVSSPWEVLLALVCCAVVASSEQGFLGLKLCKQLAVAQWVLHDIFPDHIANKFETSTLHSEVARPQQAGRGDKDPTPDYDSKNVQRAIAGELKDELSTHANQCLNTSSGGEGGIFRRALVQTHDIVSILFADIVGFTSLSEKLPPLKVMETLHTLYSGYDSTTGPHVYKVETIGDCYMAATGLFSEDRDHAVHMVQFALRMQSVAATLAPLGHPLLIRIGIHSGGITSGLIGNIRRRYCLFGDTVNTASRMESTCTQGCIQVSSTTYELVKHMPGLEWVQRHVMVKGKGTMITYVLQAGDDQLMAAGQWQTPAVCLPRDQSRPEPLDQSRPEPLDQSRPEPLDQSRPEPLDQSRPEPLDQSRPEPLDQSPPEGVGILEGLDRGAGVVVAQGVAEGTVLSDSVLGNMVMGSKCLLERRRGQSLYTVANYGGGGGLLAGAVEGREGGLCDKVGSARLRRISWRVTDSQFDSLTPIDMKMDAATALKG